MFTKRHSVLLTIILSSFLLLILSPLVNNLYAYSHFNAHIEINAYSFAKFTDEISNDVYGKYKKYENYNFSSDTYKMEGYTVKAPGYLTVEEELQEGNYQYWIASGGLTADEPELLSALRHFYDPLKMQTDKDTGKRVSYLTDHVSEIMGMVLKTVTDDPRMDAREWALTGPARRGYPENRYSLRRGAIYMRRAWAEKNLKMKNKLFAAAWRSCGETMHLLSDMTVPAHVRNDAHPIGTMFSGLRYDPYEHYVTSNNANNGNIIKKYAKEKPPAEIAKKIDATVDAFSLFHTVALYTNQNFFSADTLSGKNSKGEAVHSANGMRDYPSPSLNRSKVDALRIIKDNRTGISLAHADWAENDWWNTGNYLKQKYSPKFSNSFKAADSYEDVALDQAKLLIPVAVKANGKLLEMFIPELEVKITKWDSKKRVIRGSINHKPSGVYTDPAIYPGKEPLLFNNGSESWSRLTVNNRPYSETMGDYKLTIVDNQISVVLGNKVKLKKDKNRVHLNLFFGGFWVKSVDVILTNKSNKKAGGKSISLSGSIPQGYINGQLDLTFQKTRELSMGGRFDIEGLSYSAPLKSSISANLLGGTSKGFEQQGNLSATISIKSNKAVTVNIHANAGLENSSEITYESDSAIYNYRPVVTSYLLEGASSKALKSKSGSFTVKIDASRSCRLYALVTTVGKAKIKDKFKKRDPLEIAFDSSKFTKIAIGGFDIQLNENPESSKGGKPLW